MTTRKLTILFLLVSFLIPTKAESVSDVPKAPCRLQISDAHISTSLLEKRGLRAVKINASSICNIPQSNVTITVEIWKTGLLGNHFVSKRILNSPGTTLPNARVNHFLTFQKCKNKEPTQYFGIAYSKAFIAGKWQYARHTQTKRILPLKCGT